MQTLLKSKEEEEHPEVKLLIKYLVSNFSIDSNGKLLNIYGEESIGYEVVEEEIKIVFGENYYTFNGITKSFNSLLKKWVNHMSYLRLKNVSKFITKLIKKNVNVKDALIKIKQKFKEDYNGLYYDILYNLKCHKYLLEIIDNYSFNYYERMSSKDIFSLIIGKSEIKEPHLKTLLENKISEWYIDNISPILIEEFKNQVFLTLGLTNWMINIIGSKKVEIDEIDKCFEKENDLVKKHLVKKLKNHVYELQVEKSEQAVGPLF